MIIEAINNSFLVYNPEDNRTIHGFYMHCVNLIKKSLIKNNLNLNVILGNYSPEFSNTNKIVKIGIQYEHTLVKLGGRSVQEIIFGDIKHEDGVYLIRIDNFEYYNNLDSIIEYSLANIHNISTNKKFDDYLKRVTYISSAYYNINFEKELKTDIITMFVDSSNFRRNNVLSDLANLNVPITKIQNCYDSDGLNEIYKKSKILINVHQTEHHHTLEELRILPALMTGVLIISEKVPLTDIIPYSDYIIWSNYENIAQTTFEVMNNYEYYYNKIFIEGKLTLILSNLIKNDENAFDKILINL